MQFLNCCVRLSTHTYSHTLSFVLPAYKMDGSMFFTSSCIITLSYYKRHRPTNSYLTVSLQYAIVSSEESRNWVVVFLRKLCVFPPPPESSFQSVGLLSTLKNGDFPNIRIYLCSQFWIKQCNWPRIDWPLFKSLITKDSVLLINFKMKVDNSLIILRVCKFGFLGLYMELKWWFHLFTRCWLNAVPRS